MNRKKAFIFDMDGTLVDNMGLHIEIWIKYLSELGIKYNKEDFSLRFSGKPNEMIVPEVLGKHLTESEIRDYGKRKEAYYREVYRPHIKLIDGLREFLVEAKESDISLGIATSAERENVDFVLDELKIRHFFEVIISAEDVKHHKPHPEPFLKTAELLGVEPENSFVFEDSISGLASAKSAGMDVIAISTTHKAEELKTEGVLKVISTYDDILPAEIINMRNNIPLL